MQVVFLSATSVTVELINNNPYFSVQPYHVKLNHKTVLEEVKTNVFSLYHLEPDTSYEIEVDGKKISFKTASYSKRIDVIKQGAIGDGVTDNTKTLQQIIDGAPDHVYIYFGEGIFLTGPLFLKSNQTIELDKNAVLLGLTERTKYPILKAQIKNEDGSIFEQSSWEGVPADTFASIITGIKIHNVKIIGEGVIDCNAQNSDWWVNHKVMQGGAWRPKGVFFNTLQPYWSTRHYHQKYAIMELTSIF